MLIWKVLYFKGHKISTRIDKYCIITLNWRNINLTGESRNKLIVTWHYVSTCLCIQNYSIALRRRSGQPTCIYKCENAVTITDLLMKLNRECASNWNSEGYTCIKTSPLHRVILMGVVLNSNVHWLWKINLLKQILCRHISPLVISSVRNKFFDRIPAVWYLYPVYHLHQSHN